MSIEEAIQKAFLLEPYLSVHEDPKQKQKQMASKLPDIQKVARVSQKRVNQKQTLDKKDTAKEQQIVPYNYGIQHSLSEHRVQLSLNSGTTWVGNRMDLFDGKVPQNASNASNASILFDIPQTIARLKEEVLSERKAQEFEDEGNLNGGDPQVLSHVSNDVGEFRKRLAEQGKKLLNHKHSYQLPFPISSSSSSSSSSASSSSSSSSSSADSAEQPNKLSKEELHRILGECLFNLSSQEMEDFVTQNGYPWADFNDVPLDSTKTELMKIRDNLLKFKLQSWGISIQASSKRCNEVATYMAKFCLSDQEQERIFRSFAQSATAQVRSSYGTMDQMLATSIVDPKEVGAILPVLISAEQVVADSKQATQQEEKGTRKRKQRQQKRKSSKAAADFKSVDPLQEFSLRLLESKKLGEIKQVREDVEMDREAMGRCLEQALGHFDQRLVTLNSSVGGLDLNIQRLDGNIQNMHNNFVVTGNRLATVVSEGFSRMQDTFRQELTNNLCKVKEELKQEMKESLQESLKELRQELRQELQSREPQSLGKGSATNFRCIE